MKRTTLLTLLLSILAAPLVAADPAPARKPNILFIVADDMGFSDVGCYGGEIQTPNLDRLAANGLRYSQFYNTARCWSSRACVLTGYYAQAVRRDTVPGDEMGEYGQGKRRKSGVDGVRPRWAQMLPAYLKPLGYRSYHSGKWHMDGPRLAAGFDRSYSLEDHNRYFAPTEHYEDDKKLLPVKPGGDFYTTTFIADNAIKHLKEHAERYADQPFFEYLAFTSPHFPLQALSQDIAIYRERYRAGWDAIRAERHGRMKRLGLVNGELPALEPLTAPRWNLAEDELHQQIGPGEVGHAVPWASLSDGQKEYQAEKMAVHAAMVHRMDLEIGRVLDQLRAMGALDNTVIFFVSDNGASAEQIIRGDGHDPAAPVGSGATFLGLGPGWASAANTPLRLHKSWVHEGGIATPLILHWPAGLSKRGELRTTPGHLIDLVPTVLEITGARQPAEVGGLPVPPLPGRSLVPVFSRDGAITRDCLWWMHDGNRAIRIGDWKLVADHQSPWELYDLSTDRSESRNLAAEQPERVEAMEKEWLRLTDEWRRLARQDPPPGRAK